MYYDVQLKNCSNNKIEQLKLTMNHKLLYTRLSITMQPELFNILMEGHKDQVTYIHKYVVVDTQMTSPHSPMEALAPDGTPV